MSIETTGGSADLGAREEPVCMYDTVTGMAFGPTFDDTNEADAFVRWFARPQPTDGRVVELRHMLRWTYDEQKATADEWRNFLADHAPEKCPYDGQDNVGFLSDRDSAIDGQAWTPTCDCPCHERGR